MWKEGTESETSSVISTNINKDVNIEFKVISKTTAVGLVQPRSLR